MQTFGVIINHQCSKKLANQQLICYFYKVLLQLCNKMSNLGDRIKLRRKQVNMSQSELAAKAGVSYAQIGRYETKGAQPPTKTLTAIADALDVSADFLIYGDSDEKAKTKLTDSDLINHFKAIEEMDEDDKNVVKKLIDAFITKRRIQKLAH
jgi:transcriptional regulator with XRE-family HTH domain